MNKIIPQSELDRGHAVTTHNGVKGRVIDKNGANITVRYGNKLTAVLPLDHVFHIKDPSRLKNRHDLKAVKRILSETSPQTINELGTLVPARVRTILGDMPTSLSHVRTSSGINRLLELNGTRFKVAA